MFKHILPIMGIIFVVSLSARVTVINNTDEDIDAYAGYQGWIQAGNAIRVKKNGGKNFSDKSGIGGIAVVNAARTKQMNPVYTAAGKETWSYDSITATITKDANGTFKAVVEPKQTI